MSVSGISSSSFLNAHRSNVQNQQQWQQEFQMLGQKLLSGRLSSPLAAPPSTSQTELAALQQASPAAATPAVPIGTPATPIFFNVPQGTPAHGIHNRSPHHLRVDAGDNDSNTDTPNSNPLEQTLQSGNASTAQQAYSAWQQDLQQVALDSDLLTAQAAAWQPASGSVSLRA